MVDIKIDGTLVDVSRWGDSGEEFISDGMVMGNVMRPYIFAPIYTTGLLVVLVLQ